MAMVRFVLKNNEKVKNRVVSTVAGQAFIRIEDLHSGYRHIALEVSFS
jgi:hypothetical protein